MKQTKPFGRAFIPAAELVAAAADTAQPAKQQYDPGQEAAAPAAKSTTDVFHQGSGARPVVKPFVLVPWNLSMLEYCVIAFAVVVLLTVFVLFRDSVAIAGLLQQVTTAETVMICKDGKMVYPDYSILDRLMNNGRFLCTEWSVQRGFMTLPRH